MLLAVYTYPNIMYLVKVFIGCFRNPRPIYCSLIIEIFYYFFGIIDLETIFKANYNDKLVSFTNSDYYDGMRNIFFEASKY